MTPSPHKHDLVWIDCEMTGLDPARDKILEVAVIVTDGDLNVVAEGPHLVIHQSAKTLKGMDDWNRKQHGKSGLVEAVKKSRVTEKKAEALILEFLKQYCLPNKAPLCGNSVHHDRKFIARYMPKVDSYLHYRHVDASTIKCLIDRWYPKHKDRPKKKDGHRALDDIRESIEEMRFYRKTYFK